MAAPDWTHRKHWQESPCLPFDSCATFPPPLCWDWSFYWSGSARPAQDDPLDPALVKAILRTETPEEGQFIERTVALVNAGKLPRDLFEELPTLGPQEDASQVPVFQVRAEGPGRRRRHFAALRLELLLARKARLVIFPP